MSSSDVAPTTTAPTEETSGTGSDQPSSDDVAKDAKLNEGVIMQASTNETETVILYNDPAIEYTCPRNGQWTPKILNTNLPGNVGVGPGCQAKLRFKGDSIQVYGGTGPEAGVFGCSIDENPLAYKWFDGRGDTSFFHAYKGLCFLSGIGLEEHTISVVNNPNSNTSLYITGFRYTTNETAFKWAEPLISGCCKEYKFAENEVTTIAATPTGEASATSDFLGVSQTGALILGLVAVALIILSSLIVGCICCRKKPPKKDPHRKLRKALLAGFRDSEKRKNRKGRTKDEENQVDSDDTEDTDENNSDDFKYKDDPSDADLTQEKKRNRKNQKFTKGDSDASDQTNASNSDDSSDGDSNDNTSNDAASDDSLSAQPISQRKKKKKKKKKKTRRKHRRHTAPDQTDVVVSTLTGNTQFTGVGQDQSYAGT